MKSLKLIISILILLITFSCGSNSDIVQKEEKPIKIEMSAGIVLKNKETQDTRALVRKKSSTLKGTPDVEFKWEYTDSQYLKIALKQETKTVLAQNIQITGIKNGNKTANFSFDIPSTSGLDLNKAITIYGVYGKGVSLDAGGTKVILPTTHTGTDLSDRVVLSFKQELLNLADPIHVQFKHVYALMCLRLQNSMGERFNFPNSTGNLKFRATSNWLIAGGQYDIDQDEIVGGTESSEVEFFTQPDAYIVNNDIQEYWAFLSPKSGLTKNPPLKLVKEGSKIAVIDDELGERTNPLIRNTAYYIAGKLTKAGTDTKLEFIPNNDLDEDAVLPVIKFTTSRAIGKKINLKLTANPTDKVWIDLNNNGKEDSGESISAADLNYSLKSYTIGAQNMAVYGKVTKFNCVQGNLTHIDATKNILLEDFRFYNNQVEFIDISNHVNLIKFVSGKNKLKFIDVSKNTKLEYLGVFDNEITNVDVSTNKALNELNCYQTKIKFLDISRNYKLNKLSVGNTPLESLDVSKNTLLSDLQLHNVYNLQVVYINQAQEANTAQLTRWSRFGFSNFVVR